MVHAGGRGRQIFEASLVYRVALAELCNHNSLCRPLFLGLLVLVFLTEVFKRSPGLSLASGRKMNLEGPQKHTSACSPSAFWVYSLEMLGPGGRGIRALGFQSCERRKPLAWI